MIVRRFGQTAELQLESNLKGSKEEEVEGFCVGAVASASSGALNVACELCEDCFKMTRTEMRQTEHLHLEPHTHEKNLRVCKRARCLGADDDDKDLEPWFVSMSHSTEDCTKQPVQCTADFRLSTWPPQRHFVELGIGWIHIDQLGTDSKHVTVTWNPQVSHPQHTGRSHYPRRAPLLGTGLKKPQNASTTDERKRNAPVLSH